MVKSIFSILSARQTNILSGAFILMLMVFASKFLGLIRDRLLVNTFDTATASIFFGAFKLPDLLFQLLIFGGLSVAFIPVFTEYLHQKDEKQAFFFAANILNLSFVFFVLAAAIGSVFVSPLNSLLVPGFSGEQKALTDELTRIILVAQIILVIGAFFIAISQSFQRFIVPALAPLFYNLGIIAGIIFLSPSQGIFGPAYGVVLGAVLHVLIQLPIVVGMGFRFKMTFNFLESGVRDVIRMMSVRNIGLAVEQINDSVSVALASLVSYSSVTLLTFAQHLQVVPIGLFGATMAQAALPVLSREHTRGEAKSFKITLLTTMHQILFLTLPATAILIVLRIPVVRLVFGASQFNWEDTVLTGLTVAFFAAGIAAQSVILLLVRGFYAFKDTKTPVTISVFAIFINILASLMFIQSFKLGVWSLGLSYSISTNLSALLLVFFLNKKVSGFSKRALFVPAAKMLLAALVSALALYIPIKALDQLVFDTTRTINLIILTGIAACFGLGIYLLLVWLLRVQELYTFIDLLKRTYRTQFKVKSEEIVKETGAV